MKHLAISLITYHLSLITLTAAVPLRWTVETSRIAPAVFDVVRGETIALEAAFNSAGKPFAMDGEPVSIFWQTNGMGSAWWTAPAVATSNLVRATFTPAMDPGAATVNGFLGSSGSIYRAAFTFRFRHGPGAVPNTLPLPVPVIDFAKVRVLNPPWSGGGGGGVDTNAVRDIAREEITPATNRLYKTLIDAKDGAARPLPKYLHALDFDDSYPDAAAEYYLSRGNGKTDGGCSSVRDGGFLYRNFDYPFDDRAEFIVRTVAAPATGAGTSRRFASVGVAQVGTNLTERMVTSGKWSKWYKALPGATVDGINENGVACNINVVDGEPAWHTEPTATPLHPLAAIRWILDHATNAQHAAEYIAANIRFPAGWTQNFHYMIADAEKTYIVENGYCIEAAWDTPPFPIMTNHSLTGLGQGTERYDILLGHGNITNVWYTNAYRRETTPPWVSDLREVLAYTNEIFDAWATHDKEYFRGKTNNGIPWWQTVHTSIYDITNRTLRIAVQETDDWYTFQVPSSGAKIDAYTKAETDAKLDGKLNMRNQASGGTIMWNGTGGLDVIAPIVYLNSGDGHVGVNGLLSNGPLAYLDDEGNEIDVRAKANKPYSAHLGNLASLTADGDLADSGIAADDVALRSTVDAIDNRVYQNESSIGDLYESKLPLIDPAPVGTVEVYDFGDTPGDVVLLNGNHSLRAKADVSMIHHTNETFSNEVATVARTVTPQPSPTLRLFDPVLNRWVILKSVNMNLTLEVE